MKKCSACGNVLKDEVMQCPYCGNTNFIPENYQSSPQIGQTMQQPMVQQPAPGYSETINQQSMSGYDSMSQQPMGQIPMGQQPTSGYGSMGQQPMPGPMMPQVSQQKGNILWGVVGFLIPIVGWILYFVWKNTKPGDAKVAGIGGIIGFCFNLFIQFIF